MKQRLLLLFYVACYAMLSGVATAAINSGGIVNAASYRVVGLPNSGIAQGSIFLVFGTNLGPAQLTTDPDFPLGTSLAGTSIQVTVNAVTVDCLMIYTSNGQVAAILPSNTPVGAGQLRLSYNNAVFTEPIQVVRTNFGIFTSTANGVGQATLQIFEQAEAVNLINKSIFPGQYGILWGTGLGPATGNEAAGPLGPQALGANVQVYVGGVLSPDVFYAGRSGCCGGQDQIIFKIPEGVDGCYVPLVVTVDGIPSNYTYVSVSQGQSICTDPNGLTSQQLTQLLNGQAIRVGSIALSRTTSSILGTDSVTDFAFAGFESFTPQGFIYSTPPFGISTVGACTVFQFSGEDADDPGFSLIPPTPLEAGASLTINGPNGQKTIPRTDPGEYFAFLNSTMVGGIEIPGGPPYLAPGTHTVAGPGGTDVPAFQVSKTLPQFLVWSNKAQINNISRANGVTVTWTGGGAGEVVYIIGYSATQLSANSFVGAGFTCQAPVAAGSFEVGPAVLQVLPASMLIEGFSTGGLLVGSSSTTQVAIPNLDIATYSFTGLDLKLVNYQ
jgi:uncharacterized protein (TIGR03437 family)